ncbi:MAG: hypothetical protein LUH22_09265 [Bacteroides sp.]|nr:hypothetical protein [Bacteroides sp.]
MIISSTILEGTVLFWVEQNIRIILCLFLAGTVFLTFILLYFRGRSHKKHLMGLFEKYRTIYDEYKLIYENMPVGVLIFDQKGTLLAHNPGSDIFFQAMDLNDPMIFNLFTSDLFPEISFPKIRQNQLHDELVEISDSCFRVILRCVQEDKMTEEHIMMLVLDHTDILKEKRDKEQFHEIFNFSMDMASLGVAEYNLIDKKGFATHSWFQNLYIQESDSFSHPHERLIAKDREKIDDFFQQLDTGNHSFADTLCLKDKNTLHWIYYVIQVMEYAPEQGRVIVTELVVNIDEQILCEQELEVALKQSRESDRLKNAFIAHMSLDIQPYLSELVSMSTQLTQTHNQEEKQELMVRIEENKNVLLDYINQIIDLSKTDTNKLQLL